MIVKLGVVDEVYSLVRRVRFLVVLYDILFGLGWVGLVLYLVWFYYIKNGMGMDDMLYVR